MSYFKRNKLLFWIIIVLLIINASALITLVIQHSNINIKNNPEFSKINSEPPEFIFQKLQLDTKQRELFRDLHTNFRNSTQEIKYRMQENRALLLDEMMQNEPDTSILNELVDEYGYLHKQLKINTIKHFMDMKKNISPQQTPRFNQFLKGMIESEGMKPDSFKTRKHMYRHRWGRNR